MSKSAFGRHTIDRNPLLLMCDLIPGPCERPRVCRPFSALFLHSPSFGALFDSSEGGLDTPLNIFRRLGILKRRFQYTPDIVQRLGDWRPCEVPPIGWPKIIIFILAGNPEPDDKFSCFSVSVNKGGGALFRARHLVKRFWESPPRGDQNSATLTFSRDRFTRQSFPAESRRLVHCA